MTEITEYRVRRDGPRRLSRLPYIELARYVHSVYGPDPEARQLRTDQLVTDAFVGHYIERDRRTVLRWRHEGIPLWSADEIATKLGLHPTIIWPEFPTVPEHEGVSAHD